MSDLECTVCASGVTSPHGAGAATPGQAATDLRVLAYETYFTSIGGPMDGNPIPCPFGELELAERIAWTDVVGAVRDALDAAREPHAAPVMHQLSGLIAGWRQAIRGREHAARDDIASRTEAETLSRVVDQVLTVIESATAQEPRAADGKTPGQLAYEEHERRFDPNVDVEYPMRPYADLRASRRNDWERIAQAVETEQVRLARADRDADRGRMLDLAAQLETAAAHTLSREAAEAKRAAAQQIRQGLDV